MTYAAVPIVSAALWIGGFVGADPRSMGELGLLSLFDAAIVASLVILLIGFVVAVHRGAPEWILAAYMVTYIAFIHATPAVLYGTLRYSWAYKHVGIVDYILRHGRVDPTIGVEAIYHNWPGFFAGNALMTSASGHSSVMTIAMWAPATFNLMNLLVLRFVFRGLTTDRRVVWIAILLFFITDWVGQDYFSPQAMAFVLYMAALGILIRRPRGYGTTIAFTGIVAVMAASHQITSVVLVPAVAALVLIRRVRGWYLPVIAIVCAAGWAFTFAYGYTSANLGALVDGFGRPVANADQTLHKTGELNPARLLVVWGGRAAVAIIVVLAASGAWRSRLRRGRHTGNASEAGPAAEAASATDKGGVGGGAETRHSSVTAIVLAVVPVVLLVMTSFSGEALFRVFLFASPFTAFLAAGLIAGHAGPRTSVRACIAGFIVVAVLTPCFLLGYYGKERLNYFSGGEVAAARWVAEHAEPGSLLVEGDRNYPSRFADYEKFTYVTVDREPPESAKAVLADPVAKLYGWLSDPVYSGGYVIITRGQIIAANNNPTLPAGSLERVEAALRTSARFHVAYEDGDAVVFMLTSPRNGGPP